MENEQYLNLMFERYKKWLVKGTFTREYAAYEFMKRNPYFINLVTLYRLYHEDKDGKNISTVKYYKDDILHVFNQVFLYSGDDVIISKHTKTNTQLLNWVDFDESCAEEHYSETKAWYSYIYEKYRYEESDEEHFKDTSEANRDKIKKMFAVDLDEFSDAQSNKRWLSHLLPATYLKINPLDRNEDIIKKLKLYLLQADSLAWDGNLNDKFDKNSKSKFGTYSAMSTPEIILQEEDSRTFTFDNGKYYDVPMARALIMYDLIEVFKITDAHKLSSLLRENFGDEGLEGFMPYFDYKPKSKNWAIKFKSDYITKKKQEILTLIFGKYLNLVYPEESIITHKRLVARNFSHNKSTIDYLEMSILREEYQSIKPNPLFNIASLDDISLDEYKLWTRTILEKLENEKIASNVFKSLLL